MNKKKCIDIYIEASYKSKGQSKGKDISQWIKALIAREILRREQIKIEGREE